MMKMFKKKTRVLNAELPRPLQRNAMSTLYANLGFMSFDKPMRTIVVTSSVPNEGKTTVAVELARVMAVAGKRTLLVECDLRRRSLADRLGVRAPVGLCAVVMGDEEPGRAIVATRQPRMHFLDAEAGVTSPVDSIPNDSGACSDAWPLVTTTWSSTLRRWARSWTPPSSPRYPMRRCSWCAKASSSAQASRRQPNSCARRALISWGR